MDAEVSVSAKLCRSSFTASPKIDAENRISYFSGFACYCPTVLSVNPFAQLSRFSKEQSLVRRELPSWRYSAFLFDTVIVYIL